MTRILIIDDDKVTREILNETLEPEGYILASASNGKEGLKLHNENPFDLIITDIIMPEMEGLETIRELRRISPTVKIIAISGGGRLDPYNYLTMAKKMGADLTFYKPLVPEIILNGVQKLIGT
ncbi:MAG: response regulator [Candidatus Aminicenantes bacterium]|nr:MAG: response regulator [Candidatus Aminicenantes bacterium]